MSRLLILRPEPGASETLERARSAGLEAVKLPLFEIEPIGWEAPEVGGFDGLLLTSANAVRAGGERLKEYRGLPTYAVGRATAAAAREAGFDIAATGDAGAERLLESIDPELRLFHPCGEDHRDNADAPQQITSVPVYRSRAIDDPDLGQAKDGVALLHSPRAARRFAELVDKQRLARSSIAIAAISTAALAAAGENWSGGEAAGSPDDATLLALAARLCNNPAPR